MALILLYHFSEFSCPSSIGLICSDSTSGKGTSMTPRIPANGRVLRTAILSAALAFALACLPQPSHAQTLSSTTLSSTTLSQIYINPLWYLVPAWTCKTGDGAACSSYQLANPAIYRQILILPTGYTSSQGTQFYADTETLRNRMSNAPGPVYSSVYKSQLLYIAYWVPGSGDLSSGAAAFGGKVFPHPVRGKALTCNQDAIYAYVDTIRSSAIAQLWPGDVVLLYNTTESGITANATPPSFSQRNYGISRMTLGQIQGNYVGPHEIGHGLLSWVDEYVEPGFENVNITQFDILTPLAIWDGSLGTLDDAVGDLLGVYDMNISEVLVNNGADNVALSRYPATVYNGLTPEVYTYQGGMFFGQGTWHAAGRNLMNDDDFNPQPDNGFAYAHSSTQQRIVNTAFVTHAAGRANDRLRNAGPVNGWPFEFGSDTTVMLFDGDKNHHWQPTQSYNVVVGWYERNWHTCWAGPFPYPCYDDVWTTVQKTVYPTRETLELKTSTLFGLASLTQNVVCGLGLGSVGGNIDICTLTVDQMANAFIPTLKFTLPYQYVTVPASQWWTTYYWCFSTWNGTYRSGYTSWASFYRSL
jgi:hypothetical protein